MQRFLAFAVMSALSGAAVAQTTINCSPNGMGGVRCTSNAPANGIDWVLARPPDNDTSVMDSFERGRQARAAADAAAADANQRGLGARAGAMVRAGDCSGAIDIAVSAGDFALANSIKQYCVK